MSLVSSSFHYLSSCFPSWIKYSVCSANQHLIHPAHSHTQFSLHVVAPMPSTPRRLWLFAVKSICSGNLHHFSQHFPHPVTQFDLFSNFSSLICFCCHLSSHCGRLPAFSLLSPRVRRRFNLLVPTPLHNNKTNNNNNNKEAFIMPFLSCVSYAAHIQHIRDVAGVDHVGIGSG